MQLRLTKSLYGCAARLMLVAALVLAAFSHSPATHAVIANAQYAVAYTLPDGSTPVLCDPSGKDQSGGNQFCNFCIIASGTAFAGCGDGKPDALAFFATAINFNVAKANQPHVEHVRLSGEPRAPPAFSA